MADTADMCMMESKITSKAVKNKTKTEREYKKRKARKKGRKLQPSITVYVMYIPSLTEKGIVTTP